MKHWLLVTGLLAVLISLPALAADPAAGGPPPPQTVVLRVGVDATGHVVWSNPVEPQAQPGLVRAAQAYAGRLLFTPARKDGVAVASETSLYVILAVEPAVDGKYALKLRRATNGPGVVIVGHLEMPAYTGRRGGAIIVVSVDVDANGVANADTIKTESAKLREPNKFAEARYLDVIHRSVKGSRFVPDQVAGQPVASRVMLPYRFGMGGNKPKDGEEASRSAPPPSDPSTDPAMTAVSAAPGIELPKVEYLAPAKP